MVTLVLLLHFPFKEPLPQKSIVLNGHSNDLATCCVSQSRVNAHGELPYWLYLIPVAVTLAVRLNLQLAECLRGIKCQTGADSGNPRLCSESGSNLYGVYQVRYAFYTSLVCFFNHYLSYCFLIQLERFLFPSPVLVYYLVRFLSRAPVSLPLFSVQRDSGGWTCVFSFSLLLKLAFSCRLRG